MKKPLNYYGIAFDDPKKGYNKEFLSSKKGKKEIKKQEKSNKRLKKQIKKRGFDDSECWNLDVTIAKFTLPRLRRLKEITHGYPGTLDNPEEWDKILDQMIRAFEIALDDEITEADIESYETGMKLFAEYFRNLWD